MRRAMLRFVLPLAVLIAVLVAVSLLLPTEAELAPLSALVLRSGEGNAVLVSCGGQTLLLQLGDAEDEDDLERYLHRHRLLRITHTARAVPGLQANLYLGDAVCLLDCSGELPTLTVTHGENRLLLRLPVDGLPELQYNQIAAQTLPTDRHSVRIFSDGDTLSLRPDFSAWDD